MQMTEFGPLSRAAALAGLLAAAGAAPGDGRSSTRWQTATSVTATGTALPGVGTAVGRHARASCAWPAVTVAIAAIDVNGSGKCVRASKGFSPEGCTDANPSGTAM